MASGLAADAAEADWLPGRRARAADRALATELPTRKTRRWEFTGLDADRLDTLDPAGPGDEAALARAESYLPAVAGARRVDQVDATTLSEPDELPEAGSDGAPTQPVVCSLAAAARRYPQLVSRRLGSVVSGEDALAARNEAGWQGGAFVYVPPHTRLEQPVQLSCVQDAPGTVLNWRSLIVLGDGAEAEVWERWLSSGEQADGLVNVASELVVGAAANLRYVCGQDLSERAWVLGTQRGVVDRDGTLEWVALGLGAGSGKVRMETRLAGRGSTAKVTGAYAVRGDQHLDFDTNQEHAAPDTTSDLAFRGILDDHAHAVWWGMIVVDPGAQRTDAFQESRNLLVSSTAHADAIPGLEIQADDVRCTHAAAVAQLDAAQMYYLRSRGLEAGAARRLVIEGFLAEMAERLPEGPIHDAVAGALDQRLNEVLGARPEQLQVA